MKTGLTPARGAITKHARIEILWWTENFLQTFRPRIRTVARAANSDGSALAAETCLSDLRKKKTAEMSPNRDDGHSPARPGPRGTVVARGRWLFHSIADQFSKGAAPCGSLPGQQSGNVLCTSGRSHAARRRRLASQRPVAALEALEDRVVLSAYTAATAAALIADINAANKAGGANTIKLTAPTSSPYVFSTYIETGDGFTVLPSIAKGDALTILTGNGTTNPGYGDVLDAAHLGRVFDVEPGGSLTLENVTLQNGLVNRGSAVEGGAVFNNAGSLVLSQVMIQNNAAGGPVYSGLTSGGARGGGGIWSDGLTEGGELGVSGQLSQRDRGDTSPYTMHAYGARRFTLLQAAALSISDSFFGSFNAAAHGKGNTAQGLTCTGLRRCGSTSPAAA